MTKRLPSRHLILAVPLLIGAAAVAFWVGVAGGEALLATLAQARLPLVAALLAITTCWLSIRFVRWQFLLRRAGVRIPARPSLSIYLAGLLGTATPAYVGELVRGFLVKRRFGVPLGVSTSVLIFERLADVAALALVALLTARHARGAQVGALFLVGAPLAALILWPLARRSGLSPEALARLRGLTTIVPAFALSLAAWGVASLLFGVSARALRVSLSALDSSSVFASSTLLGALTLLPAGFGASGSVAIFGLADFGLAVPIAVAVVALARLAGTGVSLAVGAAFLWRELHFLARRASSGAAEHFDQIASEYGAQWTPHVWDLLLERKLDAMTSALPAPADAGIGLDLGCGLARQVVAMSERGFRVVGIDRSLGLLAGGRGPRHALLASDALELPFADESLDFAFCIGVLHHLADRKAQADAYAEVARVLRPGGVFLVHESNPRNPVFRLYMGYLFPVLKSIDLGTEWWIPPDQPDAAGLFRRERLHFFTWIPDFTPRALLPLALRLERLLERGPFRSYSAHYLAVLRKAPSQASSRAGGSGATGSPAAGDFSQT